MRVQLDYLSNLAKDKEPHTALDDNLDILLRRGVGHREKGS
jgi:hypothetical protein